MIMHDDEHDKGFIKCLRPRVLQDAPFIFNDKCHEAFQILKKALISAPIIQPCVMLATLRWGAILVQTMDKKHYAISYASKTLIRPCLNYAATEKDLLAVVFAVDKFRSYLLGTKVIVYTDHVALNNLTKKDD
jgi:hypothetical protein